MLLLLLLLLLSLLVQQCSPLSLPTSAVNAATAVPAAAVPNRAFDVVIFGSGPTSLSLASLLTSQPSPPSVAVVSKDYDKPWVPNYGAWETEWSSISSSYSSASVPNLNTLGVDVRWPDTSCYFTEGPPSTSRVSVGAPYVRLSRSGLKKCFTTDATYTVIRQNHVANAVAPNVYTSTSISNPVTYSPTSTTIKLSDNSTVTGRIILDGTGAESLLTIRDSRDTEGYQIAYGVECKVEGKGVKENEVGDYEGGKMTLFDYRVENFRGEEGVKEQPTFMYVMPLGGGRWFFEETSLVARPGVR